MTPLTLPDSPGATPVMVVTPLMLATGVIEDVGIEDVRLVVE